MQQTRTKGVIVLFGLVSLLNGISNFVDYLMPNPCFKKNGSSTI